MPRADQPYSRESLRKRCENDPGFEEGGELDLDELRRRGKRWISDVKLN